MTTINVHQAKTHFSRLLAEVEGGGEVVIARAGKPVARLVPIAPAGMLAPKRRLGMLEGRGFRGDETAWTDRDQRELEASFYDGPLFPEER